MSAQAKILSQAPTELELQVAQAFIELENSSPEMKAELRPLQFKSIREVCQDFILYEQERNAFFSLISKRSILAMIFLMRA